MIGGLRALAVFSRVTELGSFRLAAKALDLSPSVVSHHVARLEESLGVPLLYRTTRRLSLTPEGEGARFVHGSYGSAVPEYHRPHLRSAA